MDHAMRRTLALVVLGVVVIGGVFALREAGMFRSAQSRANEEFALSERAHHDGDFEAATRHMENAVKLDPHFVEAREGLAALYEQLKGAEAAIAEYQRGIAEDPQNTARYCYQIAQTYFGNRQWEPALEWLRRAESLEPDDFHVQRMIGFCLERQGKWREAEEHWSNLLQKNANDANIRRSLERVRRHLNNTKQNGGKGG